MRILALDTSSAVTSVAVLDGDHVVAEREHHDPRRHAEVLAVLVREILPPDVAMIACGVGPGPYTGLRAGIATAQALGLARSVPVIGVCSLDAIAHAVAARETASEFSVGIDARRKEMYWGRYAADGSRISGPDIDWANGWSGYGPADGWFPRAADVGRIVVRALARGEHITDVSVPLIDHRAQQSVTGAAIADRVLLPPRPLYIRRPDVTV